MPRRYTNFLTKSLGAKSTVLFTFLIRASKRRRPDWTAMRANELRLWFAEARSIRHSITPTRSSAAAKALGITPIHPLTRRRGYRVARRISPSGISGQARGSRPLVKRSRAAKSYLSRAARLSRCYRLIKIIAPTSIPAARLPTNRRF